MDMLKSPFLSDMMRLSKEIYAKGWGEANGGNISMRITPEEMYSYQHCLFDGETKELPFSLPDLAGDYFLVTGTGVFYRNVAEFPHESLGIVKISDDGKTTTKVWGYTSGGRPTSELPAHLLSHSVRKAKSQGQDKIVLHTHATNLIALSFVLPLDTKIVTKELWEMMSECVVLFPDGIGVMPWMMPGSLEIGKATAEYLNNHSLVMWAHHGIFGAGKNIDQVFGLIETADKAAEMLLKVMAAGGKKQAISAEELKSLANAFGLTPLAGVLD